MVNRKEISINKNPDEVTDVAKEIINFNKQQEGKRLKKLTSK